MDDDIEPQGPILPRARKVVSGFAEVGLSGAEELLRRMSPEGREQARRERAAKARRQRRLALRLAMASAGALLVWAVLAAVSAPGVALAVAMAALIVVTTLIVLHTDPRAPGREALVQAALPDLVDEADIWLAGYQRGLPPPARQLATDIRHRLDGLRPLVTRLDPRSPAAGAIHKLVSIELPDLVDGWRDVPPAARRTMLPDGRTPDDHLVNGLHLIDAELTRLRGAAGDGALDGIAVQGRYLELKYGNDGQLP
ncbi:hypothetical protein [Sphingomonas sp. Leaf10]|uniref:hypothetical protein n=1 Tax=Sphingomonas sp. Leaf10 TaxID=1735676 RepID=UPI0012E328E4|nr:hypothetical protein [Sphingomonas sp. Leaf10]